MSPSGQLPPAWISPELRAAIQEGWEPTYKLLFDKPGRPFVSVLAKHHREGIKWHWAARHRQSRLEVSKRQIRENEQAGIVTAEVADAQIALLEKTKAPQYMAYFSIWSRGHMKSTIAKRIAIVDAILSVYYNLGGYCLYFSGTDSKTSKHAISIEKLLQDCVRAHVPALAEVNKSKEGGRTLGWKATFFYTRAGYVFHFGSLQSGMAGGNVDDVRPTIIIPDDTDDRKDSAVQAATNFNLLTTEILLMGSTGTLTFWAQNLINRYSSMYKIWKGHARVLTNRKPTKPIPAVLNPRWEERTIKGIVRDILVSGTPTWRYFGLAEMQEEVNRSGKPAFLRECQHEVEQSNEGLMIHTYDDMVHPISTSEFASKFGTRSMPVTWPKEWGNDWARTKTAYHANVAMWRTVSSKGSALPGLTFYFHPMSFLKNAQPEDVAERVLSCLDKFATRGTNTRLNPVTERRERARMTWSDLRRDELIRANALEHTETQLDRIDYERAVLQEVIPQYSEPLLQLHNVVGGVNSHERDDIREIYNNVYALKCEGVNPGKFGGVEQLNRDFKVDFNTEHPFRPGVMGYTRTFVVVPDDESQKPVIVESVVDGRACMLEVYPPAPFPDEMSPDDLHDDRLYRYQMKNWRAKDAKVTESGETIDDVLKMNDDFGNLQQMFCENGYLPNVPLSHDDEFAMLVESQAPELVARPDETGEIVPIPLTKQDQQKLEAARHRALLQLTEKYGEDVLENDEEPNFEEDEVHESNWWD